MKLVVKADAYDDWISDLSGDKYAEESYFKYDTFEGAITDNYDRIVNMAIDLDKEAWNRPDSKCVISIDLDGIISSDWYPAFENIKEPNAKMSIPVVELCHAGEDEQFDLYQYAFDNFLNDIYVDEEIDMDTVEKKYKNEIEFEKQLPIEDMVRDEVESYIEPQIDNELYAQQNMPD